MATPSAPLARLYEKRFPDVNDLVVVNVRSIADMGAYVTLLEYGNIEGMILMSELSRRRIRSITKLIRVGREEVVKVLRVDTEKQYIDLSKSRVDAAEIATAQEKFNKAKTVQGILRATTEKYGAKTGVSVESLCERVSWPLYRRYGHAYTAFQESVAHPEAVFTTEMRDELAADMMTHVGGKREEAVALADELLAFIKAEVARKLRPEPIRMRADMHLTCFTREGVEAIKAALIAGEDYANAPERRELGLKIALIAPPLYFATCTTANKSEGIAAINGAVQIIEKVLTERGGKFALAAAPRAVSDKEERRQLGAVLKSAAEEAEQGSGDDESGSEKDSDDSDNDSADGSDAETKKE
jgi:translation initiation factor 2 subunit 1